jgi:hypothetical protein
LVIAQDDQRVRDRQEGLRSHRGGIQSRIGPGRLLGPSTVAVCALRTDHEKDTHADHRCNPPTAEEPVAPG